ncbi:hypothetical protein E2C01_093521 [Portunus trituberculatus]|uniref:Uncharacterized protein n=1 Tax=Portunus trituberculatus TaxID=210409 RepID=A0A5B7JYY2_PORTR|nr:hypothetical protein [Portunus trituberculatus]
MFGGWNRLVILTNSSVVRLLNFRWMGSQGVIWEEEEEEEEEEESGDDNKNEIKTQELMYWKK